MDIVNFIFLLMFIAIFIGERYYFYKYFCTYIQDSTIRPLCGLPTNDYKPFEIPTSNTTTNQSL